MSNENLYAVTMFIAFLVASNAGFMVYRIMTRDAGFAAISAAATTLGLIVIPLTWAWGTR